MDCGRFGAKAQQGDVSELLVFARDVDAIRLCDVWPTGQDAACIYAARVCVRACVCVCARPRVCAPVCVCCCWWCCNWHCHRHCLMLMLLFSASLNTSHFLRPFPPAPPFQTSLSNPIPPLSSEFGCVSPTLCMVFQWGSKWLCRACAKCCLCMELVSGSAQIVEPEGHVTQTPGTVVA